MKITKYRIQNYKAINDIEIKLNYSINPIIGVNESGKTTILQAILAFDKNRDKTNLGKHLEYQNKYSTKDTRDCKISAYLKLDTSELKELIKKLDIKTNSEEYKVISQLGENFEFILTRELSTQEKEYIIENHEFPECLKNKTKKILIKYLPYILYFDDFSDRVPDEIAFNEDFKISGKLAYSRNREWQEIIIEIFKRAEAEGIDNTENPLQNFFQLTKVDRKDDILSDIQDVLNSEIIEEWKKIKKSGLTHFADDSDNLSLELKCDEQTFRFKVKDKSNQDRKRTFNVSERSKGFQWFFNYMVKLKFNPRYKGKQENSIFLLDEPGSYLHSSAQSELLKELKAVSKKNIIIYCTHSQYLLNPQLIKLGSIKIAEKDKSNITLTEYGHYKGKDDKGALSAVYQALNLNFTNDFVGKTLITEGVTDFYFFEMLKKNTDLIKTTYRIIPGSGSGNLSNLISVGLSFSENFLVFFDNDSGAKAIKKYVEEFGDEIKKYFVLYSDKANFRLENFLSTVDKEKLLEITKTNDMKRAFAFLYYDYITEQKRFFSKLEQATIKNLEGIITKLNAI